MDDNARGSHFKPEEPKYHLPYHESDHVLNFASNALCHGTCLDDIELRRNDVVFLDALGADRIPDPTTAGDFCRRFSAEDVETLQDVFDQTRLKLGRQQPVDFFDEAVLDVDSTLVATGAGCKQGIDIAYDGTWGYHPLIISLANTGEVLSLSQSPRREPARVDLELAPTATAVHSPGGAPNVVTYRPTTCHRTYRLIVVRQTIAVEKGQTRLFDKTATDST